MTAFDRSRVKDIFFEVCEAPPAERAALLDSLCAGEPSIRTKVEALLAHDTEELGSSFLQPAFENGLIQAALAEDAPPPEPVGAIAGCRIIRKIGEGGMGAVYECEQETPRRRVAIKLVRPGLNTTAIQRRFRQEAEILGQLRHPNIARVYGAGATSITFSNNSAAPTPYLMMEYIDGMSLCAFAREKGLAIRQRVELLTQICDGVQHAHAKGVIHRDLKPGNILVELPEPGSSTPGTPRILDFGIARLTDPFLAHATLATQVGQVTGTLAYMPPEQVEGDPKAIDTRADVYALGVVAYELLGERLPLALESTSLAGAAQIIQTVEPPALSTLSPALRGDLSTIVSKAMRKSREERYQTAAELAADLRRYLAGEPIAARPATAAYVLRKFALRNRALVAALAIAAVLLIVGTVGTTVGLVSAMRSNTKLEAAIHETKKQLTRSEQVVALMRRMLFSVRPAVARDRDTTIVREVLESAAKQLESGELKNVPEVEAEMRATIAETYQALGDNNAALAGIERAMDIVRAAPSGSFDKGYLRIRVLYASILQEWHRFAEAAAELEFVVAAREEHRMPDDADAALTLANYASAINQLGKVEEGIAIQKRVLAIRRCLDGEKSPSVAVVMGNIAGGLQNLKRYDEALEMLQGSLHIYEQRDPPSPLHLTIIKTNLASLLQNMGRNEEAEQYIREAIATGEKIYKPEHQQMGMMRYGLAMILVEQHKPELALDEILRALSILRAAFGETHPHVTSCRRDKAAILASLHRFEEAQEELLSLHELFAPVPSDDKLVSVIPSAPSPSLEVAGQLDACADSLAKLFEEWHAASPDPTRAAAAELWRLRSKPPRK